MSVVYQFDFSPEVQALRKPILSAIRQATAKRTLSAVQEALRLSALWLQQHPEDYAILDVGSDLTRLEEALLQTQAARLLVGSMK